MQNRMIIGGHILAVTSASLKGVAHQRGFFWKLEVCAKGRIEEDEVSAVAQSENWFDPMRPVSRWQDILQKEVSWKEGYDSSDGDARGLLYVYSHEVIENASMKFSLMHGDEFRINWTGTTDVSAGCFDDYDKIVFDLDTNVSFVGIETRQLEDGSEQTAINRYVTATKFSLKQSVGHGFKLFFPE